MAVRGDFAELAKLRAKLKDASSGGGGGALKARLLQAASAEALTQVKLGFRNEQDPSGTPWLPLKYRRGKIMRKTGRMANAFTSRPTDSGFVVGNNVFYTRFQQRRRAMVPVDNKLTQKWRTAIDKATDVALKNFLKT